MTRIPAALPARDDDAFVSAANQLRYFGTETAKLFLVESVGARLGEDAGAEFNNDTLGVRKHAGI